VSWEIYLTDEVNAWLDHLLENDSDTHRQVVSAVEALADAGPNLGRPLVDRIKASSLAQRDPAGSGRQGRQLERLVPASRPPRGGAVRDLPEGTNRGRTGGIPLTMKRWSDVRDKHIAAAGGAEAVREGKERLLAQVRAHRLAEIRKRQGLTQRDVAAAMGISVGRVSQIEAGDISGIDVLDRYVTAIGGLLEIVATFGEEQFKVG
jgi:DNA-binding transcriptional regulator YiaG